MSWSLQELEPCELEVRLGSWLVELAKASSVAEQLGRLD